MPTNAAAVASLLHKRAFLSRALRGPLASFAEALKKTISTMTSAQKVCQGFLEQEFNSSRSGSGVEVTGSGYILTT